MIDEARVVELFRACGGIYSPTRQAFAIRPEGLVEFVQALTDASPERLRALQDRVAELEKACVTGHIAL